MKKAELAAACLSFDHGTSQAAWKRWEALPEMQQQSMLAFADRAGLSLYLSRAAKGELPHAAEYRARRERNQLRLAMRRSETAGLVRQFHAAGLRVAVLKGFLMAPDFVADAADRSQYDLDFLLSPRDAQAAFELLCHSGWRPITEEQDGPTVHLPTLVPEDMHAWHGDFYDPQMSVGIEFHSRLWVPEFECIPMELSPDPLTRLVEREGLPTLHPCDQLTACTLHVMRHVFRGNLRMSHLYELATFLRNHADDDAFWSAWTNQPLCNTGLALAARAFHCLLPVTVAVPRPAAAWIERFGPIVVDNERRDKQQVFLQLAFVTGWRNRLLVLRRRLLPLSLPGKARAVPMPAWQRVRLIARRAVHHVVALLKLARVWP